MNAKDWEQIQKNYADLLEVNPVFDIYVHLFQKNVLTLSEKIKIEKLKVFDKQMGCLLKTIKKKPQQYDAFRHFIDALKIDPVNRPLADKIIGTESKADASLSSKPDPHLLDEAVRRVLLDHYVSSKDHRVPLHEVRELLKSKLVFTGQNEWSNEILVEFIKTTFTQVEANKEKEQSGSKKNKITYLTNIGRTQDDEHHNTHAERSQKCLKSSDSIGEVVEHKAVTNMTVSELKSYLTTRFQNDLPIDSLEVLENENISGEIFLSMKEEDFRSVLPNSSFGVRRKLVILVKELSHQSTVYPEYLRKFRSEVTQVVKYYEGHCSDVSVNIRARKTVPVKNFYLVDDNDKRKAIEFITSEAIPFISACLNDRRNGTIYFGISPNSNGKYRTGEVVGVSLLENEVKGELRDAIKTSFTESQKDAVLSTVREALFVPIIGKYKNKFVIELDIEPSTLALDHNIIRTKEPCLPERFLKNHKGKDAVVFRFSDEGFPKIVSTEELCQYEQAQQSIVEQRKQEEVTQVLLNERVPDLRIKFLNLLTGGPDIIHDTIYPFLMTSPLDDHMTQDYLKDKITFIKHLHPQVVFDFDDNGATAGLLKNLEEHHEEHPRILTTSDFDKSVTKQEEYDELISSLEQEMKIAWMFCNGYQEQSLSAMEAIQWNKERSSAYQEALKCFMNIFEKERIIIIICLLSKNYVTMIEACDELLRKLPEKWIVLAETEDIAKLWQDQILIRNRASKSDVVDNCVIGLPWEQVNTIICKAANREISDSHCISSSKGSSVSVRQKKLDDWCDICVLPSNNFDLNIPIEEREKLRKDKEEKFYRGEQVDWWNFAFQDQVLRRDIHATLLNNVRHALEGRMQRDERELVNVVPILHQPGAGGTTSAKQILWDLRNEYRCCIVERITNQTCDQLEDFRQYKDECPKPILILVDNEEKFEQLKEKLEEKGRKRQHYCNELFHVYCTVIMCTRRASLPLQLKGDQVALRQELTSNELDWFQNKHKELMKKYNNNKDKNVNPEFLIAFNILRQNFDKKYVGKVVKAFTLAIKSRKEIQLLKIVAILNTFDPNFKAIPVSCFDKIINDGYDSKETSKQESRKLHFEAHLSQEVKVLLNLSSKHKSENKSSQHLQVFCKIIAQEILKRMKGRTGQTDSDIMFEILNHNIFQQTTADFKVLQTIINDIFKKRELEKDGVTRQKFSEFIQHVETMETTEKVSELLECLFTHNDDPFTAQLLARYYIKIKLWSKAENFAKCAIENLQDNSFLWDTYGQVFKNQLYEKVSFERNIREKRKFNNHEIQELINLTKQSIIAFRKGQDVCEHESSTHEENNLVAYFGELRVITILLSALKMTSIFKSKDVLHRYLVDQHCMPTEMNFLSDEDNEFLKSLENCSKEAMRRLDDEFLQMKGTASTNEQQDIDRKRLIELKASLDAYFGEFNQQMPSSFNERDSCDFRLRRARLLGASSLNSLLELKKEGKEDLLLKIFNLLQENMKSTQKSFDDLRSMLDIVTVLVLNGNVLPEITYNHILEWSKQMYSLRRQRQKQRSHLEVYLYYVLYNFPTQERCQFSLAMEADLLAAIEDWKKAFKKNYPKSPWYHKRRETTLFFLGNGEPLSDIVFFDKTEVIQMYNIPEQWQKQYYRKNLKILTGILGEGGLEVTLQFKSIGQSDLTLKVPTAYPIENTTMYKRKVCFYIGFSFSGPKAFGMCLERPRRSMPLLAEEIVPLYYTPTQSQTESLDSLLSRLKKCISEQTKHAITSENKSMLEEEEKVLKDKIKQLMGQ